MRGYKVFKPDWTCRDMQYEVGKSYEMTDEPVICKRGFHFCEKLVDCFDYYEFDSNNKVAEIEAYGDLDIEEGCNKCCTNKIKIIHELNWHEVFDLVNTGKDCTGNRNSGNCNSGDYNSGNCNSGNSNSGDYNSGNCNSGNCNSGDFNSGNRNSGDYNSGDYNSGNCNNGNSNSGDYNSGDYNSGDYNSGDWNSASYCIGCFNTISQPLKFFDKPSNLTLEQWRKSKAYWLLSYIRPIEWIYSEDMTEIEKESHPDYETTGGYLKDNSKCCAEWWEGLTKEEKKIIKGIPNFDSEKFYQITGIKVE